MQTDGLSEAARAGMSKYRGGYRIHHKARAAKVEDKRSRFDCSYVESPAKMEKALEAALERKCRELAEQREEIRRVAAIRRGIK